MHGISTNHSRNTGKLNYALIYPSITGDGNQVMCGARWKGSKACVKIIIFDIKTSKFREENFEDAVKIFNFEGSFPSISYEDITRLLYDTYKFKPKEIPQQIPIVDVTSSPASSVGSKVKTRTRVTKQNKSEIQVTVLQNQVQLLIDY